MKNFDTENKIVNIYNNLKLDGLIDIDNDCKS